ncbi:hypothetical protein FF38_10999 [Lucilia cuprina]|uniref:Uncharacterized protein n=1 Tax=Lucilia cuprina TaxID=7375 RepID=A0A0L0BMP3_LUCCU|nr:hypothetical protein FF38_10999 [Lucilia cuprina]
MGVPKGLAPLTAETMPCGVDIPVAMLCMSSNSSRAGSSFANLQALSVFDKAGCLAIEIPSFLVSEIASPSPLQVLLTLWDYEVDDGFGDCGCCGGGAANVKDRQCHQYPSLRSLNQQFRQVDVSADGFGSVVAAVDEVHAAATTAVSSGTAEPALPGVGGGGRRLVKLFETVTEDEDDDELT